jgi:catechol 2,3-dioxygenase-like lactoylglutathione lyase family enzyme
MTDKQPRIELIGPVLDAPDPPALAAFYRDLLGWTLRSEDPTWVRLVPPNGNAGWGLSFQLEPDFVAPAWPSRPDRQQMMAHLDIAVDDVDAAVAKALALGARLADFQPQDDVRVCFDPVGHPFCLFHDDFSWADD